MLQNRTLYWSGPQPNLTRIRIPAHSLEVKRLRYQTPAVPYCDRYCRYCTEQVPGNEAHFLMVCPTFLNKRQCFLGKSKSLNPKFSNLCCDDLVKSILCPTTTQSAKLLNKYITILLKARKNIDEGTHVLNLTFPPNVEHYNCPDNSFDDSSSLKSSFSSIS